MIDVSAGNDALKIRYNTGLPRILLDDPELAPFYADLVRKEINSVGRAFGSKFHLVLKVGDPETAHVTLADALTKAEASTEGGHSRYKEFQISPTKRFAAVSVSGSAWRRSMSDMQSFVKHNSEELDSGLRTLHRALSNTIAGEGYGVRGQVESVTSTTVVVKTKADMFKFRVGQEIECAQNKGSGSARSGSGRITAINRSTKTLTVTGVDPSASSWTANDYLFQKGDFNASALSNLLGVEFWIPVTVPGAGADASGIDRTSGPELHGHRVDVSTEEDMVDAILEAAGEFYSAGMRGGKKLGIYVNPLDFTKISKILTLSKRGELENNVKGEVAANVGYSRVVVGCAYGTVPIIPDRTFPRGYAFFLNRDTFFVAYDGKEVVAPIDEDGLIFRAAATTDKFTARMVSESQLICEKPGDNGVATLPT